MVFKSLTCSNNLIICLSQVQQWIKREVVDTNADFNDFLIIRICPY